MIPFSQMGISVHVCSNIFLFFFFCLFVRFFFMLRMNFTSTKVPPQRCEQGSLLVRPKHLVASEIGFSVTANWEKGTNLLKKSGSNRIWTSSHREKQCLSIDSTADSRGWPRPFLLRITCPRDARAPQSAEDQVSIGGHGTEAWRQRQSTRRAGNQAVFRPPCSKVLSTRPHPHT